MKNMNQNIKIYTFKILKFELLKISLINRIL